jgi:hypothetical protein
VQAVAAAFSLSQAALSGSARYLRVPCLSACMSLFGIPPLKHQQHLFIPPAVVSCTTVPQKHTKAHIMSELHCSCLSNE